MGDVMIDDLILGIVIVLDMYFVDYNFCEFFFVMIFGYVY